MQRHCGVKVARDPKQTPRRLFASYAGAAPLVYHRVKGRRDEHYETVIPPARATRLPYETLTSKKPQHERTAVRAALAPWPRVLGVGLALLLVAACATPPVAPWTYRPDLTEQGATPRPLLLDSPITLPASPTPGPVAVVAPTPSTPPPGAAPAAANEGNADTDEEDLTDPRPEVAFAGRAPWQIRYPSTPDNLTEAYASAPSYLPGDTLRLAVSTTGCTYKVTFWRIGTTMRLMAASGYIPGVYQTGTHFTPATNEIAATWRYNYAFRLPATWPSGVYLAKVASGSQTPTVASGSVKIKRVPRTSPLATRCSEPTHTYSRGSQSYALFVVRSSQPTAFLFVNNALNYQAYNAWGGSSLYQTTFTPPYPGVTHAFAVSFNRPYLYEDGAGQIFMYEVPFIRWLEKRGYDLSYTTDYDLSVAPQRQPVPRVVLFSGHSEYWGMPLRTWLDQHVIEQSDMSLGLFAADSGYWPVRFTQSSPTGPRTAIVYKLAEADPKLGGRAVKDHSLGFRSLPYGVAGPQSLPEQALFGVQYGAIVPGYHNYYLTHAPAWLLAGTGLYNGQGIGLLAGGEVDRIFPDIPTSATSNYLVTQAYNCHTLSGETTVAQAVLQVFHRSGRVFAAGTFWWPWGLDTAWAKTMNVSPHFAQLTDNLLQFLLWGRGTVTINPRVR